MNSDALTTAIQAYFAGERQEGFAILAFSAGLVLVAGAVHDHSSEARAMLYAGRVRAALAEKAAR